MKLQKSEEKPGEEPRKPIFLTKILETVYVETFQGSLLNKGNTFMNQMTFAACGMATVFALSGCSPTMECESAERGGKFPKRTAQVTASLTEVTIRLSENDVTGRYPVIFYQATRPETPPGMTFPIAVRRAEDWCQSGKLPAPQR
jgi:protein involved in sex pheromone biosynthesis